jgi:hypothetical protein
MIISPKPCTNVTALLVLATIAICTAILYLTPEKQSAKWVFTTVTDGSGWGSKSFSFLLGFLSVTWTMTDYDGTTQYAPLLIRSSAIY